MNMSIVPIESAGPRRRTRRAIELSFGVGRMVVGATGLYGQRENRAARDARARLADSYEVLQRTLEIERLVVLMEDAHRAFLVTGDARFERRREAGHAQARAAIDALLAHTGASSTHALRLRQAEQ